MKIEETDKDIKISVLEEVRENYKKFSIIIDKEKDEVVIQSESKARLEDMALSKKDASDFLVQSMAYINYSIDLKEGLGP